MTSAAALQATAGLTAAATAGPDPAATWTAYMTASGRAAAAWQVMAEIQMAGGTTTSAGLYYSAAYQAQAAADQAYSAWLAAQNQAVAGARG